MPEESRKQESPIKASARAKQTLKRLSKNLNVRQIDALDWAVDALADYYEHHGNRLLLPLRFYETFSITTIDPTKPLTLFEPPRAESKSGSSGARGKTKTTTRR